MCSENACKVSPYVFKDISYVRKMPANYRHKYLQDILCAHKMRAMYHHTPMGAESRDTVFSDGPIVYDVR